MAETVYLETHSQKKIYGPYSAAAWNWDSILWDTAAVYGMGASETILGEFVDDCDRDDLYISTKFTPQIAKDVEHPIETMMDESLKRLHTDYVDLYWIYNPATWKDGQRKSSPS